MTRAQLSEPSPPSLEFALAEDGKPLARGRKSAKKREAIIRAAIEVINAKSFALATMTDIAASLDLRDATLYYYFPSKQALVYVCHLRSLERFEKLVCETERRGGPGVGRLRFMIRALLVDSVRSGPLLYFGDYSYLEQEQRSVIADTAARLTKRLEQFLHDGMEDGSVAVCEPALVVQLLLGMLIWLAKWTPAVKDLTADQLMRAIEDLTFKGLERQQA